MVTDCNFAECPQKERIIQLEKNDVLNSSNISHLVERLDGLISILKTISLLVGGTLGTTIIAVLGFLIIYWIKG
jgi:hypothetical protein